MSRTAAPAGRARWSHRVVGRVAAGADQRYRLAKIVRKESSHVFPKHFSFFWGELALYSFIVLLLSGTFLAFFYHPDTADTVYHGQYVNLRGVHMSRAYESVVHISFDVRAGLFIRQMHHWAAHIFIGSMVLHMWRNFFTGAYRKPRELTWIGGVLMLILAMLEGFTGYSMIDDLLSGLGVRIVDGLVLSIPVIGTWLEFMVWGGEYVSDHWIGRFYIIHVWIFPMLLIVLVGSHLGFVWYQKHTQYRGQGATEKKVVGERVVPGFAIRSIANGLCVFGVIGIMAGLFEINPSFLWGEYTPADSSTGAQPDWYVAFLIGALRIMPRTDIHFGSYVIPAPFWPGLVLPVLMFGFLFVYPYLEARIRRDRRSHNVLERPRDNPVRTGIGAMMVSEWILLTFAGSDDVVAFAFHFPFQWLRWGERIGFFIVPIASYLVAVRLARRLQRRDRDALAHGLPTGLLAPGEDGVFVELRQPPGGVDAEGRGVPMLYGGARVDRMVREVGANEPTQAEP